MHAQLYENIYHHKNQSHSQFTPDMELLQKAILDIKNAIKMLFFKIARRIK